MKAIKKAVEVHRKSWESSKKEAAGEAANITERKRATPPSQKRITAAVKEFIPPTHGPKSAAYYVGDIEAFRPILEFIFPPSPHDYDECPVVVFPRGKNTAQAGEGTTEAN